MWHLLIVGGKWVSSMWWHCCFLVTRKETRRRCLASPISDIFSVCEDAGGWFSCPARASPWKLFWCETGICMLATTQLLGGCLLSFAFLRLVMRGCLWEALMLSQEARRACPGHTLLAWPYAWAPKPRKMWFRVATLYAGAHSQRPCLLQILHNSRLIFL